MAWTHITREMENRAELVQDKYDNLIHTSNHSHLSSYSVVLDEFSYRMQKIEEEDPDSFLELMRELAPYIMTTAAVIEAESTTVLIFYLVNEERIYDDEVYRLFDRMTQGKRGVLLEDLGLLPDELSNDMKQFSRLRNIIAHEYQSRYFLQEAFQHSGLDEDEFGDTLLAGIRSVQGLHALRDEVAPDAAIMG